MAVLRPALLTSTSSRPWCPSRSRESGAVVRVGDVGGDGHSAPADSLHHFRGLGEPVGAPGTEHQVGASVGQRDRETRT